MIRKMIYGKQQKTIRKMIYQQNSGKLNFKRNDLHLNEKARQFINNVITCCYL